jgi:hypothetical protein
MASNARANIVADRIRSYLFARAGAGYCFSCIATELKLSAAGVRGASMWVRGFTGIRDAQGACTACGSTRRLVLTATRPLRHEV